MSDVSQIWLGAFTTIATCWGGYLTYLQMKLKVGQDNTNQILDELRHFSEGRYFSQLKITMEALSRVSEITKDPADILAASIAKKAFVDRATWLMEVGPYRSGEKQGEPPHESRHESHPSS